MELGIYIHIPFCIKKCYYCDFISYPNKYDIQEEYVNKIIDELKDNKVILNNNKITTIYFGGGTPSSIKAELIVKILNEIYEIGNIKKSENMEITIEANPGTVTKSNLKKYFDCGINRLSIGLQSANDDLLKLIGRIHNYKQFKDVYDWAIDVGFKNINVDLMLGLPNQRVKDLKDSLDKITNFKVKPKHISVYSLIIEDGTRIDKMLKQGTIKLVTDEEERNQYKYVKNYLELKGYKHYEISNFAQNSYESKHNLNCWEQKQYIGIGVAAHSYINGCRYSNTINIDEYLKKNSREVKTVHENQNKLDMEKEYMILGLRKLDGVYISKFKEKFGENPIYLFKDEIQKLVEEDLLIVDLDNIKLTDKGLDFANIVWEEFI